MKEIHIKDFCEECGQARAAEIMGCTQGAVSLMLKAGREIYFTTQDNVVTYYEIRRPGRKRAVA